MLAASILCTKYCVTLLCFLLTLRDSHSLRAMSSRQGNLYADIPLQRIVMFPEEVFTRLLEGSTGSSSLHIDRIVSTGHVTDWLVQDDDEWVVLLEGDAKIAFQQDASAPEGETRTLVKGDYLFIPRGVRHKVVETSTVPAAIWLAIHSKSPEVLTISVPETQQTMRELLVK